MVWMFSGIVDLWFFLWVFMVFMDFYSFLMVLNCCHVCFWVDSGFTSWFSIVDCFALLDGSLSSP